MTADIPKIICRVKALYSFSSSEKSSLSFEKDEYIDVLSQLDSGWWDGWCKGNRGWFPSNYVKVIDDMRDSDEEDDSEEEARTISLLNKINNPTEIDTITKRPPPTPQRRQQQQQPVQYPFLYHRQYHEKDEEDEPKLPEGWILQIADDGITRFYYNKRTGGLRYTHPGILDSDNEDVEDYTSSGDDYDFPSSIHSHRTSISSRKVENFDDFGSSKHNSTSETLNLMSYWTKRTTPQGKVYYGNSITHETTWNIEDIDPATGRLKSNDEDEDEIDSDTGEQCNTSIQQQELNELSKEQPMTWKSVAIRIAQSVQDLNSAITRGENAMTYKEKIAVVVNAVRYMLYSSRSMDKDAPHLQYPEIKESLRIVLSTLAKLILSAKVISDANVDIKTKIQRDANDVLNAVRKFVLISQNKNIAIEPIVPQFVTLEDDDATTEETEEEKRKSNTQPQKPKYLLNQDLIVSLQTHVKQIEGSTDALCKASAYIYTLQQKQDDEKEGEQYTMLDQRARSNVILLFQNLSSQIGNYLGILTDIDTTTDAMQLPSLPEFRCNKQKLYNAVGLLFSAVQTLTDTHQDLPSSVHAVETQVRQVEESMEHIFSNAVQMVGERKIWLIKNGNLSEEGATEDTLSRLYNNNTTQHRPSISSKLSQQQRSGDSNSQFWFLGYDYAEGDIEFTQEKTIKGGTLRALVERLTLHDYIDMSYIANFLLTYRSFCTTEEFVDLLQERYNLVPPEGLTPDELEIWTDKKQKLVRLRVFNVMKNWLENYYNDEDEFILNKLQFFANTVIADSSSFSAEQLNRLIRKRRELDDDGGGLKRLIPNATYGPTPIMPKNMQHIRLLDTDPLELARQLTIMDFKLYSSIRPIECLGKAWSKEGADNATNVKQSIDYCNRLTSWVTGSILNHKEAKKRVVVIKYWSQVANRCLENNNYNTCMAILSAFDNSAIGRLKKTWELVSSRTSQSLAHIRKLMGSNRNFTEYREMIHSVNPPCIPFLGIYLQDLTFIEDGNPDFLKTSSNLINFAKQQKSAEVIREIKQFQSPPYIYQFVPEIQDFIKNQLETSRDIDFLYERSLELEPRIPQPTTTMNNDNNTA